MLLTEEDPQQVDYDLATKLFGFETRAAAVKTLFPIFKKVMGYKPPKCRPGSNLAHFKEPAAGSVANVAGSIAPAASPRGNESATTQKASASSGAKLAAFTATAVGPVPNIADNIARAANPRSHESTTAQEATAGSAANFAACTVAPIDPDPTRFTLRWHELPERHINYGYQDDDDDPDTHGAAASGAAADADNGPLSLNSDHLSLMMNSPYFFNGEEQDINIAARDWWESTFPPPVICAARPARDANGAQDEDAAEDEHG